MVHKTGEVVFWFVSCFTFCCVFWGVEDWGRVVDFVILEGLGGVAGLCGGSVWSVSPPPP